MAALTTAGAKILRTAVDGTVVSTTDGKSIAYTTSRTAKAGQSDRRTGAAAGTAADGPASRSEAEYIGNVRTRVFHRTSCSNLPAQKNRVSFPTRDEAIAQGYRPCRNCNP